MCPEDLELVIAHSGHQRYRDLTNPEDPSYDPGYEEIVRQEAARLRNEQPLPPLNREVTHAVSALGRAVAALAHGKPLFVSEEVKAARMDACRACPFYRHSDGRCSVCGCWQDGVIGHAALATERCPKDRWPK